MFKRSLNPWGLSGNPLGDVRFPHCTWSSPTTSKWPGPGRKPLYHILHTYLQRGCHVFKELGRVWLLFPVLLKEMVLSRSLDDLQARKNIR